MKIISSTSNPTFKNLEKLFKPRERKKQGLFPVEGLREVQRALSFGYEILSLFVIQEVFESHKGEFGSSLETTQILALDKSLYQKVSYRSISEGVLGVFKAKESKLSHSLLPSHSVVIIIESIEKPGNVGAVLRSTIGLGVDLVLVTEAVSDRYNPNTIRSSLGAVFSDKVVYCSNQEAMEFCKKNKLQVVTTYLHTEQTLETASLASPSAIVLGTEATGVSKFWVEQADILCKLPMQEPIDSLNISVATALFTYEALKQRNRF